MDALQRAHAGAQNLLRIDRLAQEIGDADLQEPAHQRIVESVGEHDDRRLARDARREALQGDEAFAPLRVEIDDDDRCRIELGPARGLLDRFGDDQSGHRLGGSERGRDGVEKTRIGTDENDRGEVWTARPAPWREYPIKASRRRSVRPCRIGFPSTCVRNP